MNIEYQENIYKITSKVVPAPNMGGFAVYITYVWFEVVDGANIYKMAKKFQSKASFIHSMDHALSYIKGLDITMP